MKKIELNEEHLKSLEAFINTIPTAYGLPLLKFFGELNEAQNGQQTEVKEQEVEDNERLRICYTKGLFRQDKRC